MLKTETDDLYFVEFMDNKMKDHSTVAKLIVDAAIASNDTYELSLLVNAVQAELQERITVTNADFQRSP